MKKHLYDEPIPLNSRSNSQASVIDLGGEAQSGLKNRKTISRQLAVEPSAKPANSLLRFLLTLLRSVLISLFLKDASVVDPPNIFFAKDAIIWPEQQVHREPWVEVLVVRNVDCM